MQNKHGKHASHVKADKYATTYGMGQACDNMVRWAYPKDGYASAMPKISGHKCWNDGMKNMKWRVKHSCLSSQGLRHNDATIKDT